VTDGTVVTPHGSKFVRCGTHRRPFGVYQAERQQRLLTDTGMQNLVYPTGIVVYGFAEAQIVKGGRK
jgi:hypothetical protein